MAENLTDEELAVVRDAQRTIKRWTEWPEDSWAKLSDKTRERASRELDECGTLITEFRASGKYIPPPS